jgi:riboflavin synthase
MFTGIITEIGRVRSTRREGASMTIEVECGYPAIELGESIAVDGVCLTVAARINGGFVANMSAETLSRTTLSSVAPGTAVNLERALAVGDRLGGHIVAGHVDAVGRVVSREPVTDAERWVVQAPPEVHRYLAEKGSVAVDGVSLTVNGLGPSTFELMLVPFTLARTTLGRKAPGAPVNLEVDVLARYVARILESGASTRTGGVTRELLERAGFVK